MIDWDNLESWGNNVHESATGSWLEAEGTPKAGRSRGTAGRCDGLPGGDDR